MSDFEIDPVQDRIAFAQRIETEDQLRATHADLIAEMASTGEEIPAALRDVVDHHLGYDTLTGSAGLTGAQGEKAVIDAGGDIGDYWDNVGKGDGGFYDTIRKDGCPFCGCHTPGNCDGCV